MADSYTRARWSASGPACLHPRHVLGGIHPTRGVHQPLGAFARFPTAGSDSLTLLRELAEETSPRGRLTAVFVDDVHALEPLSAMLAQALALAEWACHDVRGEDHCG